MAVKQLQDLVAFQLSEAFKKEVYALVRTHPTRLTDGVDRGHYTADAAKDALTLSRRAAAAIAGLQRSLRNWH